MFRTILAALRGMIFGPPHVGQTSERLNRDARIAVSAGWGRASAQSNEGRPTVNIAYEKLIQHLDEREVRYLANSDTKSIYAEFRGEVGTYRIIAAVDAEVGLFQVFGYSPVRIPEGARPAIAETIVRANYSLRVGKFEMDFSDGELRFQAAQILSDDNLDDTIIGRLIGTTIAMLDMYLPAVLSVIYGNELPQDAIRCVEGQRDGGASEE